MRRTNRARRPSNSPIRTDEYQERISDLFITHPSTASLPNAWHEYAPKRLGEQRGVNIHKGQRPSLCSGAANSLRRSIGACALGQSQKPKRMRWPHTALGSSKH